jgi:hypothetical protein
MNKVFFCFRVRENYNSDFPGLIRLCNFLGDKLFCIFFSEIFRDAFFELIELVLLFCKKVRDIVRHDNRLNIALYRILGIFKFILGFR